VQASTIAEVQISGNKVKHAKCTLNKQMQAYLTCYLMTVNRVQISQREIRFQYGHCKVTGSEHGLFELRVRHWSGKTKE